MSLTGTCSSKGFSRWGMYVSACCRLLEEDKTADFNARTATTAEVSIYIETMYVVSNLQHVE